MGHLSAFRGHHLRRCCSKTLFGSLKAERLHGQRFETRRHARDEAIARLLWHSSARLHPTLAYISQMRLEQN
jgi:putative transposase